MTQEQTAEIIANFFSLPEKEHLALVQLASAISSCEKTYGREHTEWAIKLGLNIPGTLQE